MKIAFIGLGIMGRPMALNLLKGGHQVTVWARRTASMQPLLDAGASGAAGVAEATHGNELVISMVAERMVRRVWTIFLMEVPVVEVR